MSHDEEIIKLSQELDEAYRDLEACSTILAHSKNDNNFDLSTHQEKLLKCLSLIKKLRQQSKNL